jgi:MFS family permease
MWRYRHFVLILTTLAFATTMVARLVISPLVPDVTAMFGVSTSDIGLALTGMWAAYALSQYPGGMLANTYGERRIILVSVGLIAFASVLLASAPVFPVFAVVTILLGAAAGLPYSSTTSLISKNFEDIGRGIGIYIAGAPFAGLNVPIVATAIASAFGWRTAIAFAAVVAVPVYVAVAFGIGRTPPSGNAEFIGSTFSVETMVELLSRPVIRYTIVLAIGSSFVW